MPQLRELIFNSATHICFDFDGGSSSSTPTHALNSVGRTVHGRRSKNEEPGPARFSYMVGKRWKSRGIVVFSSCAINTTRNSEVAAAAAAVSPECFRWTADTVVAAGTWSVC